jgi:hypothetical protein
MKSAYSTVGLVLLLAVSPFVTSCLSCTAMACGYTLKVNLDRQNGWEPGTWEIVFEESDTLIFHPVEQSRSLFAAMGNR